MSDNGPGVECHLEGMSRFQILSDAQWELIAPMFPTRTGRAGRPFSEARTVVEAIIYRYRCGIPWRDLPEVYGLWQRRVDLAPAHGRRGHLGQGVGEADRRSGRPRARGLSI